MFSLNPCYRPGVILELETEVARHVREEADDENFFTWIGMNGRWVLSYRLPDGKIYDAAYLNYGEAPEITPGVIQSAISLSRSGPAQMADTYEMQNRIASDKRDAIRAAEERDAEEFEFRESVWRRIKNQKHVEHPYFDRCKR